MSKVIKAIIVAAMLVGLPRVSMATKDTDNNMAALGEIRAQTTLAEAQITLLEKQQKLVDLRSGKSSSTDFHPAANSFGNAPPPNMIPASMGPTGPMIQMPIEKLSVDHDEVLDVIGIDNKFTATIRTKTGIYTVNKGDRVSGGIVTSISLDRVVLIKAGKSVSLPFVDQKS